MLEILFLRWFAKHLATIATSRGRSRGWGALGVVLWFVTELTGLFVAIGSGAGEGAAFGLGFGSALISAVASYLIVSNLREIDPENAPLEF